MNNSNWKSIGWNITRKLLYYFLVITALIISSTYALSLMTVANTLAFIGGGVLLIGSIGVGLTLLIREISYYVNKID